LKPFIITSFSIVDIMQEAFLTLIMATLIGIVLSISVGLLSLLLFPIIVPVAAFVYMWKLIEILYDYSFPCPGPRPVRVFLPAAEFFLTSTLPRIIIGIVMLALWLSLITLAALTTTLIPIQTLLTRALRPAPDTPAVLDAPNASSDLPPEWPSHTPPSSPTPSLCSDTTIDSAGPATPRSISVYGSDEDEP
jgi:hypothetical protein